MAAKYNITLETSSGGVNFVQVEDISSTPNTITTINIAEASIKFSGVPNQQFTLWSSQEQVSITFKRDDVITPASTDDADLLVQLKDLIFASNGGGSVIVTGSVSVTNFPATQPISAVSLPLPIGASTEAKQDTQITNQTSIINSLGTDGTAPGVGTGIRGWLNYIYNKLAASIAITAASLPLPTGAATETTLSDAKNVLDTIKTDTEEIVLNGYDTNNALGGTGGSPPVITGTGVIGFLRAIYEKLFTTLDVAEVQKTIVPITYTNLTSTPQNPSAVKGTAIWIQVLNFGSTPVHIKFYDSIAAPTVGVDTPIYSVCIQGGGNTATTSRGILPLSSNGNGFLTFQDALWIAATRGVAVTDTQTPLMPVHVQLAIN